MQGLLRKAGQALKDLDAAYAAKVSQRAEGKPLLQAAAGQPLFAKAEFTSGPEFAAELAREKGGPARPRDVKMYQGAERALVGGIIASNAATRYAVPAAGAGLALKGAIDMAALLGQQTSSTLDPE